MAPQAPDRATRAPTAPRKRRTQAERSAETRRRILDAVVASIAELGVQRTTAAEITERAGVTWGAVQHQFGDKDGILRAVLDDSFERFAACLEGVPGPEAGLDQRIDVLVEGSWSHFASDHYRSTFQILLQYEGGDEDDRPDFQTVMGDEIDRIWNRVFADRVVTRARRRQLQRYTASVLSGLATTGLPRGGDRRRPGPELELLKNTLREELAPENPRSR